jgi:hypothetical protein
VERDATKLGIKEGHKVAVLGAPRGFSDVLEVLPTGATVQTRLAGNARLDGQRSIADRAAANTASSIRSVSRPVNVFCWLT